MKSPRATVRGIASPVARLEGVHVGKGKCYNYVPAAKCNAKPKACALYFEMLPLPNCHFLPVWQAKIVIIRKAFLNSAELGWNRLTAQGVGVFQDVLWEHVWPHGDSPANYARWFLKSSVLPKCLLSCVLIVSVNMKADMRNVSR